jgi:hypothetical protein
VKSRRFKSQIKTYRSRWHKRLFLSLFITALFGVGFSSPSDKGKPSQLDYIRMAQKDLNKPSLPNHPLSNNAWDYFHPTWIKENPWTLIAVDGSGDDSIALSKAEVLIGDPDGKIEKEFLPPEELKGRVQFWIDIYSRFSSRTKVIHDRRRPEISFGYMDFRPLFRNSSASAAEIKAAQLEKKILKELRKRLDEAAGMTNTQLLSLEEKTAIQSFLSRSGALDRDSYQKLIKNIRSQTGQSDSFLQALQRAKFLLPHIESVFKQRGLPIALARIPFVESSFNAKALSKIGAVGIWQFTPETARELIHAEASDLWSDPLRQTKSAVPDWGTTITSYNSGVGRIRRIVKKYKITNINALVELSHNDTLGFAGKNFYSEFLAANFVEAYKEQLFGSLLHGMDSFLVFKKNGAVPKEICDL